MRNLEKFGLGIIFCAMFAACGDDNGTTVIELDSSSSIIPESSSDVTQYASSSDAGVSSSSLAQTSSSSVKQNSTAQSSSSSQKTTTESSNSIESSSSIESSVAESSSSEIIINVSYGSMTDERDSKVYKTVTINEQTWMAENLNYEYNEGSAKSLCYNNSADSCAKYGRYYTWSAAMDSAAVFSDNGKGCGYAAPCPAAVEATALTVRGVCPEGWHLPSAHDWDVLYESLGDTNTASTALKSTTGWGEGAIASNAAGLSILPGGTCSIQPNGTGNSSCGNAGEEGLYWTSTENSNYGAACMYFHPLATYKRKTEYGMMSALSVRCMKDAE